MENGPKPDNFPWCIGNKNRSVLLSLTLKLVFSVLHLVVLLIQLLHSRLHFVQVLVQFLWPKSSVIHSKPSINLAKDKLLSSKVQYQKLLMNLTVYCSRFLSLLASVSSRSLWMAAICRFLSLMAWSRDFSSFLIHLSLSSLEVNWLPRPCLAYRSVRSCVAWASLKTHKQINHTSAIG